MKNYNELYENIQFERIILRSTGWLKSMGALFDVDILDLKGADFSHFCSIFMDFLVMQYSFTFKEFYKAPC